MITRNAVMIGVVLAGLAVGLSSCQTAGTPSSRPMVTVPAKREWRLIGPGTGGAMFSIAMHPTDPKTFYSGVDMGALFKTTDGGRSWQIMGGSSPENPNPAPLGAYGVALDQSDPNNVWSASGDLFKSENAGKTWRCLSTAQGGKSVLLEHVTIDPTDGNVVYALGHHQYCAEGTILRTTDGGKTWETASQWPRQDPHHWWGLVIDPDSPVVKGKGHSRLYAFGQEGIFRSQDAAATWENITGDLPKTPVREVVLVPKAAPDGSAAIFVNATPKWTDEKKRQYEGGVYCSEDGGKSWVRKMAGIGDLALAPFSPECFHLANSKARPNILYYAFGYGYVYQSEDTGLADMWNLVCDPRFEWIKIARPSAYLEDVDYFFLPAKGGNCHTPEHSSQGDIFGLAVSPCDPNVVLFTQGGFIVGTFDGGQSWNELCSDLGKPFAKSRWPDDRFEPSEHTNLLKNRGIHLIVPVQAAFDPFDPDRTLAFAYMDMGLRISRDGGTWWEWAYDKKSMTRPDTGSGNAIVYDPDVKGRLYFGTGTWGVGDVFRSDDGGRSFARLNLKQLWDNVKQIKQKTGQVIRFHVSEIAIVPSSPPQQRTLYAGISAGGAGTNRETPIGGVHKSLDGGATWLPCAQGLSASASITDLVLDEQHPQTLYAGTYDKENTGLFKTTDGGKTWEQIEPKRIGSLTANCIALCRTRAESLYVVAYPAGKAGFWEDRALFRSDDAGKSWRLIKEGFISSVAVNPYDPDWVYITVPRGMFYKGERGGVLRSKDGGRTWAPIDDGVIVEGASRSRIEVDRLDPRRLIHYSLYGVWVGFDPEAPSAPRSF